MQLLKAPCICLAFAGLLLAFALLVTGRRPDPEGQGGGTDNSSWLRNAVQEPARGGRLQADQAFLTRQRAALATIHADLAGQRTSIREAVRALRALNALRPEHLRFRADTFYPADTEDEQLARLAVRSACNWAQVRDPRRHAQVCSRLEAELRAYLGELKGGAGGRG